MRRNVIIATSCLVALLVCPLAALASGLYVPTVGARAGAMGGAFVGLADDYSAVHYNPAGIYQIHGFQATVSLQDAIPLASREGVLGFVGVPGYGQPIGDALQATSEVNHYFVPGVYVYMDGGAIADKFGICAYTLANYGVEWDGDKLYDDIIDRYSTSPGTPAPPDGPGYRAIVGDAPDYESHVTGYVISPVLAKRLSDKLSIGLTGHMLYASLDLRDGGWHEVTYEDSSKLYPYQSEEALTGTAYGATIGVLYHINPQISVGVTARTPMTVTLEGDIEVDSPLAELVSDKQSEDFDFTFPLWVAGGFAYHDFLFEGFTLTADAEWTQWSEVTGFTRNLATALPEDVEIITDLNWEDALGVHVGVDYRVSRATSIMLGYSTEDGLSTPETFTFVVPQPGHSTFSFGVEQRQDRWTLDLGLVYYIGESISVPYQNLVGDYSQGKNVHDVIVPSVSFTYLF